MTVASPPNVNFGEMFLEAQRIAEQRAVTAAANELADAKTLLAALLERPDWDVKPGEVDQARTLVDELTAKHAEAEATAHDARAKARQAGYEPALKAALEHEERLSAESHRLVGRLAEISAGLSQLITDCDGHLEQRRLVAGQRQTILDAAKEHREEHLLPKIPTVRYLATPPRGDQLASALLSLRRCLRPSPGDRAG